jgi:hypothetical protein
MDRVFIGIPCFGTQAPSFWVPLARECASLHKQNIEVVDVHASTSMMTDKNRNHIVGKFLKSKAEWLKWIDADNVEKLFAIRRLIDTQKSLVTGIYVKREEEAEPVIMQKNRDGEYYALGDYVAGQIIQVASAGLGGLLVHRQVFEDILSNYRMFELWPGGGVEVVHKNDVLGNVDDGAMHPQDGKVVDGVQRRRLRMPKKDKDFPFFMLKNGRTEDLDFFELTAKSGHQLWCDTGVELGHVGEKIYTPLDGRMARAGL